MAVLLAVLILAAFASVAQAQGQAAGGATEVTDVGLLIGGIVAGWVGNFLHRIRKAGIKETDKVIIRYLKANKIVFAVGLLVAAIAVGAEYATYAKDMGSLMWSALMTGYSADSLLSKETPKS